MIVNIDYPLGVAAYNILREIAVDRTALRGVYVLGKAATLNADVGDVMISNVVHDEHSGSTYWLDNAFSVDDLAADLRFGTGLDNQRAVTVKSTFLQNRSYLDFYYREAFTVVEMEAGPYCNAVYEIADADRHPTGEAVNFSKLPIDLGIIHYASDTPYTQARTLGARGLSYYGMDSTYASSLAILRRILRLEGVSELGADRVPGGLELGDRLEPLERVADRVLVAGRRSAVADALDRLRREPVELGRQLGVAGGVDDRVQVAVGRRARRRSSARRPESRFTTPPGTSETPSTSARSSPASGGTRTGSRPRRCRRRAPARARRPAPSSGGASGATIADHAGRLGQRERQERRRDRVDAAEHRVELVGPAGVVEEHVDRGVDLVARHPESRPPRDSSASAARYRICPRL